MKTLEEVRAEVRRRLDEETDEGVSICICCRLWEYHHSIGQRRVEFTLSLVGNGCRCEQVKCDSTDGLLPLFEAKLLPLWMKRNRDPEHIE